MAHFQSRSSPVDRVALASLGLAALLGAALALWATAPHGPGIDSDSAQYLSAARSFARGDGWIGVDALPYTLWPPLFPSAIGVLEGLGPGRETAVRGLHALAVSVVIFGAGTFVARVAQSRLAAIVCSAMLALSPALFGNVVMAWSEPIFLALCVAALHAWLGYDEQPTRARFASLCALSALALLQRYLGVTLVASLALLLAFQRSNETLARRATRAITFGVLAIAPTLLWFARNALVAGAVDGKRGPAVGKVGHDASRALEILAQWLGGYFESPARFVLIAGGIVLIVLGALPGERALQRRAPLLFGGLYFVAVIALRQVVEFDELDERLLAPLIPCVFVSIGFGLAAMSRWGAPAISAALIVLVLNAWGALGELRQRIDVSRERGPGLYETEPWQTSPTIAWLRANRGSATWLTNEPFAFFCTTDARATPLPARPMGFTKLHERLPAQTSSFEVAWFTLNDRAVFPTAVLDAHFDVERTQVFADGEIYALRRK